MMELKHVVPDVEKTFGVLEYAGAGKTTTQRVNGLQRVTERRYNLFSSRQKADAIEVVLPGSAGEKHFEYEDEIRLVNPRIVAGGYAIEGRGITDYVLLADDIVKA